MFGWIEVYLCTEQKTFFEKQDVLAQHRIRFKAKGTDSGATLGRTNLGGEFPLLGRSGLTGGTYRIFVKRKDAEQAKHLLGV